MKHYRFHLADGQNDLEKVLNILQRNLSEDAGDRFIWNQQCPHGRAHWWLAEEESDRTAVGIIGEFPRRFLINGHSVLAGVIGDFAVDKAYRAFGPALGLQKSIMTSLQLLQFTFIYGQPSFRSAAMRRRSGYRLLGSMVKYTKFLRTEYRQGAFLPPAKLTRWLAKPLDWLLALFSKERRYRLPEGYRVETPAECDERFDRMWDRASKAHHIIGERTSGFLNWRYRQVGLRAYHFFALSGPDHELIGYVVYFLKENQCWIMDILFVPAGQAGRWLLAEFLKHLRQNGVGSVAVRYWGDAGLSELLLSFGFYRRSDQSIGIMVFSDPEAGIGPIPEEQQAWYLLEGDNDI